MLSAGGTVLLLVPLIWQPDQGPMPTLTVAIYLFATWIALLVAAALVATAVDRAGEAPEAEPPEERA